eukprot:jgi/Mesen1/9994/ME000072S09406
MAQRRLSTLIAQGRTLSSAIFSSRGCHGVEGNRRGITDLLAQGEIQKRKDWLLTSECYQYLQARHTGAWVAAAGLAAYSASFSVHAGGSVSVEAPPESQTATNGEPAVKLPSLDTPTKPRVVFVLGGPGSGKGTQCAKIVDEFGFVHLSAGDLLRAEINSGSENGTMIQNMIKEGTIVPAEVTVGLLQAAMAKSSTDKFLIDGFPRNAENRLIFETQTGIEPELILFFDCPESVMEQRLLSRNQGRIDDNVETIRKRFHTFLDQSMPVVDYYETQGKVRKINATKTPDQVFKSLSPLFLRFLQEDLLLASSQLLRAIDTGDYVTYDKLCDPGLTAFEPEAQGHLVEGRPFHKFYFDLAAATGTNEEPSLPSKVPLPISTIASPKVAIIGEMGIVTYTRLKQSVNHKAEGLVDAANETRIWVREKVEGQWKWKHVHFHRSKAPLS